MKNSVVIFSVLFSLVTSLCMLCSWPPDALAANAINDLYTNADECFMNECGVEYKRADFDTASADLTINTSPADTMTCMIGILFSDSTAANLIVKSGTDTLATLELGANQGMFDGNVGPFCTEEGQNLIMQVSDIIGEIGIKLIESKKLKLK